MLGLGFTVYLCEIAGVIYPAYQSFRAIESPGSKDDTQWLTYWVVYAFIHAFEDLVIFVLEWVPFYYEFKLLFLVWLIIPQFQGATLLYTEFLKPFLIAHKDQIAPWMKTTEGLLESPALPMATNLVQRYGPEVAQKALEYATEAVEEVVEEVVEEIEQPAKEEKKET
eukprot:TRINITY_DN10916_c0_g1_i1.p2 TRINITY_DN10916_c0_g1~~TRINITY_DN10916_c0_g1_i1.p2  ORF type:complete len:168 (+),score=11.53 TRINITY_DN10916_c0_g1_i1:142-645(+)